MKARNHNITLLSITHLNFCRRFLRSGAECLSRSNFFSHNFSLNIMYNLKYLYYLNRIQICNLELTYAAVKSRFNSIDIVKC